MPTEYVPGSSSCTCPVADDVAQPGERHDAGEETEQQRSFDIVPHVSMLPEIRRRFFPVENGNGATAAFVKKNGKIEARGFFK